LSLPFLWILHPKGSYWADPLETSCKLALVDLFWNEKSFKDLF